MKRTAAPLCAIATPQKHSVCKSWRQLTPILHREMSQVFSTQQQPITNSQISKQIQPPYQQQQQRYYASGGEITSKVAQFHQFGNPSEVLNLENVSLNSQNLQPNEVLVRMLAAPINQADINQIQGNYGRLPNEFPSVGGNEGVGIVENVGSQVKGLKQGDHVIPSSAGMGTWRTHVALPEDKFYPVPKELEVEKSALLSVNPSTAYRLLNDFVDLKEGDVVIQNGANSAVGLFVIQLCKLRGVQTINLMRPRPNYELIVQRMKDLGADIVMDYNFAEKTNTSMKKLLSDMPKPKLALNAIGGDGARLVSKYLGEDGVMVTYGGMSKHPITVPTAPFIFKNISLRGFWLTRWVEQHSRQERGQMIDELAKLMLDHKLLSFVETFKFSELNYAIEQTMAPYRDRKPVLKMDQ